MTGRHAIIAICSLWLFVHQVATAGLLPLTTFVFPDDPDLSYTEYVHADVTMTRARFDRFGVNNSYNVATPGVRVNFSSDATHIGLWVDYREVCGSSGCGQFWLEVDGAIQSTGIGSDRESGIRRYPIFDQLEARRHDFSLIFPYATPVDFRGLDQTGGSMAALSSPPGRPSFLYVAFGDSITQGYYASGISRTYPDRIGRSKGWRVINMGFAFQGAVPSDGAVVGSLGADLVTVAIGLNDWQFAKPVSSFENDYDGLLSGIRLRQPTVPIYAITPVWALAQDTPNFVGSTLDDYRRSIRAVVARRKATDPYLHLVEGQSLIPPGPSFLVDGLHPNDAGFAVFTTNLAAILPAGP